MNKNEDEDRIVITIHNDGKRTTGTESSWLNSQARPFRRILENKVTGKITYVFYEEESKPLRNFGSFSYTPGNRLLFFPGLEQRSLRFNHEEDLSKLEYFQPDNYLIDHFSVEQDMKTWHLTELNPHGKKKYRLRRYKIRKYNNNVYYWFSLSVKKPEILELTPNKLELIIPSKSTDSQRKINEIIKARENTIFSLISLPEGLSINENEFLHFEVVFTTEKRDLRKETNPLPYINFPLNTPSLQSPVNMETRKEIRIHPIHLNGFQGSIFVVVTKHVGRLSEKAVISSALK